MKSEFEKTIDYKDAKIGKRQDTKTESIFISGSARDATLMTTTILGFIAMQAKKHPDVGVRAFQKKVIKADWKYWQKFFYDQMTGQMPTPPICSTCGKEMLISSKGNMYCPNAYNEYKGNPHFEKTELPPNQQDFLNNLK